MNAEEMIARNKRVAEMKLLLETPLDPRLDYFDATASIEAIADHLKGLHKLIRFLATSLAQQGQTILELRQGQGVQQAAIETLADMVGAERDEPQKLVGFDKPKLEIN